MDKRRRRSGRERERDDAGDQKVKRDMEMMLKGSDAIVGPRGNHTVVVPKTTTYLYSSKETLRLQSEDLHS